MPKDKYSNIAYGEAIESVAGTMAFGEIHSGVSLFDKVAWLISRIDYYISFTALNLMLDETDSITVGITGSNTLTGFGLSQSNVYDTISMCQRDWGASANSQLYTSPFTKDLSTLPGGGLIIPPNPLYAAAQGISLAAPTGASLRIFFTYLDLKPEEYWELVESKRIVS